MRLVFLMEAIGVPVLLSLLLLAYSDRNNDCLEPDTLPADRLQLYEVGVLTAIRKRLAPLIQEALAAMAAAEAELARRAGTRKAFGPNNDDSAAPSGTPRAGGTPRTAGTPRAAGTPRNVSTPREVKAATPRAATPQMSPRTQRKAKSSDEPIFDVSSIVRGKKVASLEGADVVAEAYARVVRVLNRTFGKEIDLRTVVSAIAPKYVHGKLSTIHAPVYTMAEYVLAPPTTDENVLLTRGEQMLRMIAVSNQEAGRREFTSVQVACVLGATPEVLGLWARLDIDHVLGVALTATLAKQDRQGAGAVPVQAPLLPGGALCQAPARCRHARSAAAARRAAASLARAC